LSADGRASASKIEKMVKKLKKIHILKIFDEKKLNFEYTLLGILARTLDQNRPLLTTESKF
jgi:hypothetical protein